MSDHITARYCAQPGGVEVLRGEAEILIEFPAADSYDDLAEPRTVKVELDAPTARRLAELLDELVPSEADELAIVLERAGAAPLKFRGAKVAERSSRVHPNGGALENRWHELEVYRTGRGKWVGVIAYHSHWQGEQAHHEAEAFGTAAGLIDWFRGHDPTAHVAGFPAGDHYADRQAKLLAAIRRGYERALGTLFADADLTEEIE